MTRECPITLELARKLAEEQARSTLYPLCPADGGHYLDEQSFEEKHCFIFYPRSDIEIPEELKLGRECAFVVPKMSRKNVYRVLMIADQRRDKNLMKEWHRRASEYADKGIL